MVLVPCATVASPTHTVISAMSELSPVVTSDFGKLILAMCKTNRKVTSIHSELKSVQSKRYKFIRLSLSLSLTGFLT